MSRRWNRLLWRIGWVDGGRIRNGRPTWQRLTVDHVSGEQVRYVLRRGGEHTERDDWLETDRWTDPLVLLPSSMPSYDVDVQGRIAITE